jgi:phosphoserine phosphatase RsbU/P
LLPMLDEVIAEIRLATPDRVIEMESGLTEPIDCDRSPVAQHFSNLSGNAVKHGDRSAPVRVVAVTAEGVFRLSVANSGDPIPPSAVKRLFQPYARGSGTGNRRAWV